MEQPEAEAGAERVFVLPVLIVLQLGGCLIAPNSRFGADDSAADGATGEGETGEGDTGEGETGEGETGEGDSGDGDTGDGDTGDGDTGDGDTGDGDTGDGDTGDGDTGDGDTGDGDCPVGTLDCDDEPGCESDALDPGTCGACDKSCAFMGEEFACAEGLCFGTVELTGLEDAEIDSSTPDDLYGLDNQLYVRGGGSPEHSYIKLPGLDQLPPGAVLDEASLYLSCQVSEAPTTLHRVEGEWSQDTITWSNAPGVDPEPLADFSPVVGDNMLDLLGLLPAWERAPNYGLALVSVIDADGPENSRVKLASSESDAGPRLTLTLSW
ncbi:putative PPE family protein PPE42 [Enhygromyxa salina]|uniref:Putative PPE family protein PPE42 n=1 Tax=Enhygromyxa salina TaxID=215803 RepID=A0A2S9XEP8_9BACT|nr:putative PPE family protein PPE42 [Enhygromyxa salina]